MFSSFLLVEWLHFGMFLALHLSDENVLCSIVAVGLKSGTEAHASCCNSIAYLVSLSHKQASVSVGSWAAVLLPLLSHFKGFTGLFLHLFFTAMAVVHFNMASPNWFCSRRVFITQFYLFKDTGCYRELLTRSIIWIIAGVYLMVGFCFSCPTAYLCICSCDRWNCFLSGWYWCFLSGMGNLGWSCCSCSSVDGGNNLGWNMSGDLDGGDVGRGILEELELESEVTVTRDSKPLSSSFEMAE